MYRYDSISVEQTQVFKGFFWQSLGKSANGGVRERSKCAEEMGYCRFSAHLQVICLSVQGDEGYVGGNRVHGQD